MHLETIDGGRRAATVQGTIANEHGLAIAASQSGVPESINPSGDITGNLALPEEGVLFCPQLHWIPKE